MELREFMNKLVGWNELEQERRLWAAYIEACNNPYLKDKPGTFKQFCDRMTNTRSNTIKMSPDKFFKIIGIQ